MLLKKTKILLPPYLKLSSLIFNYFYFGLFLVNLISYFRDMQKLLEQLPLGVYMLFVYII